MGREEKFDSFYHATRRALVTQTFALTGDLPAAQAAVRDAYIAAWHHWRKVAAAPDPEQWVRPLAWRLAQRRHTARIWHRTKGLDPAQTAILDKLGLRNTGPELDEARLSEYAGGHSSLSSWTERQVIPHIDTHAMAAATGFYSTAEDMVRFASA